jgi:hypothetical protein
VALGEKDDECRLGDLGLPVDDVPDVVDDRSGRRLEIHARW